MQTLVAAEWPLPPTAWLEAWDWLAPAVERSGEAWVESDVADMLDRDMAQLWLAYENGRMRAACVVQLFDAGGKRGLHFWLCGGAGCDWRRLGVGIMQHAWRHGITEFTIDGRRGWDRLLPGVRREE